MKNQVVSVIRFSYLSSDGGWRNDVTQDGYQEELFSEKRLDFRFRLFKDLTLPSLINQTDQDFTCVLLASSLMPEQYLERILDLVEPYPNIIVRALEPLPHNMAVQQVLDENRDPNTEYFTNFRLDDDDILAKTYIAQLKACNEKSKSLIEPNLPLVTAFNYGLFYEKTPDKNIIYGVIEHVPLGLCVAMTSMGREKKHIYARAHRRLPSFYRTLSFLEGPVWIRTVHSMNDSKANLTGRQRVFDEDEMSELLSSNFNITLEFLEDYIL